MSAFKYLKDDENGISYIDKRNEEFFDEMEYDEKTRRKMRKQFEQYRAEEARRINKIQLQRKKERDEETQSAEYLIKIITVFALCIIIALFLS